jgi:hypothetical protein
VVVIYPLLVVCSHHGPRRPLLMLQSSFRINASPRLPFSIDYCRLLHNLHQELRGP